MSSYLYGIWPSGLAVYDLTYSTMFSPILLGTHIANDPLLVYSTYPYTYNFFDWTYNCTYEGGAAIQSYISSYGITYAAVFYMSTYQNIRAVNWI